MKRLMAACAFLPLLVTEAWADGCGRASAAQRALDGTTASTVVGVLVPLVAGAILLVALRKGRRA